MLAPLLIASLVVSTAAQDSATVTARLSDDQVTVGQPTQLTVEIETGGASPESIELLPLPAGFDVTGTVNSLETVIDFSGQRRMVTSRTWVIIGRVPGTFTIPPVRVRVGNRTYRTSTIPIVVLKAPAGAPPPGSADRVRLTATVEPATVYVGQQVTFSAEAWFPNELRQRQTRPATYQAPNPAGFWAQDLPDPLITGLRNVDGQIYNTQTFRRGYFPLLPGTHVFPPARLGYEFRASLGLPPDTRELASDAVTVTVLPIPEEGRPPGYNGAVGRYTIRSAIESDRLTAGEATTLSLEVAGTGNVKALPAPESPQHATVEVFPPTESAELDASSLNVGGTKRFEWVIVPHEPGRIALPPIEYPYFDPVAARFEVARTDSIVIQVAGASPATSVDVDLRPILGRPSGGGLGWTQSPAFVVLQAVPLLVLLIAFRTARSRKAQVTRSADEARRRRFEELRQDALAPDRAFWGRLDDAIRESVAALIRNPGATSVTVESMRDAMERSGVPRPTAGAIAELLSGLDHIRFAPGAVIPSDAPSYVERADELLKAMSDAVSRVDSHVGSTATAIVLLAILAPAAANGQAPAFDRAVDAFRAADYDAAASAFLEHTHANPGDANGWYDAGNAQYLSGRTGEAVASWIRALRLRPRHTNARANLRAVSSSALEFVPPFVALTRGEMLFALAVAWWIGAAAVAVRIAGQRRPGGAAAGALIAALVIALAGYAGSERKTVAVALGPDTVIRLDPALKGEPLDRIRPGAPVAVIDRRDGWTRVRTTTGVEGWVESSLIEEV